MKSKYTSIFVILSILSFAVTYLALDNYLYALIVVAVYLLVGLFVLSPLLSKYKVKSLRFHECYHFINNFIIALSIKKSIKGSLESTVNSMPTEFIDLYEGLENMTDKDKLSYLSTYFSFYVYRLFLQIVDLWEEQGGDILKMSKYLISELRTNEEYLTKTESLATHKYVEISVLWGFCLLIVIILRFVLKDFYQSIKTQILFIASIIGLMIFILFSAFLLIQRGTNLKIKGDGDYGKAS